MATALEQWLGRDLRDPFIYLAIIGDITGIGAREILSNQRNHHIVAARHLWWACLRADGWSFPEIGKYAERNHSTIIEGIKKVPAEVVEELRGMV